MRDPLAERLARFTPVPGGIQQAELLFQAGRASVRGRRFWPALSGLLLISQAISLVLLVARPLPTPAPGVSIEGLTPAVTPAPALVPPATSPTYDPDLLRAGQWRTSLELPPEKSGENLVASGPALDVLAWRAGLRSFATPDILPID